MATREQIAAALLAKFATIASFKLTTRRLLDPAQITPALSPALALLESGEGYFRASPQTPARRTLKYVALIYNNVGGDDPAAIPVAIVNNALDSLDSLMEGLRTPPYGRVTLGGLAYDVRIEGDLVKAPGESTGLALAAVPIEVMLP